MLQDIVAPEAERGVALCSKERISSLVIGALGVLAAVHFDDQAMRRTGEVDDAGANRELTPECQPHEPMRTHFIPQP